MPALLPSQDTDLDLSILEQLDFDSTPKCDDEGCSRDATHTIRCACRQGLEFTCLPCVEEIRKDILGIIMFDPNKACGHYVLIAQCQIAPL